MSQYRQIESSSKNANGGYYHKGDFYPYEKKLQVVEAYLKKWEQQFPEKPTYTSIATAERVSINTVRRYMKEYFEHGKITDPYSNRVARAGLGREGYQFRTELGLEAEIHLLALRTDDPTRTLYNYVDELREEFGINVSTTYLSTWWKNRFLFEGTLRQTSMIPKDKFSPENWLRYYEFRMHINYIKDHTLFNFCDEKHLVNHNGKKLKVRKDPLTGDVPGVTVDSTFRDSHTIICTISANYRKGQHVYYTVTDEKNTAKKFMEYVENMVKDKFLIHNEVLILDNARIHTGKEAKNLEKYLWETVVDEKPLHIFVLFLPPRAPELNPIEIIFHILVLRLKSYHYRNAGGVNATVIKRAEQVLENISYETILRTCQHCGYLHEEVSSDSENNSDNN